MAIPVLVPEVVAAHDTLLSRWSALATQGSARIDEVFARIEEVSAPQLPEVKDGASLRSLIEAQHFANFAIWGLEDEARRRDVDDSRIATVKRGIDPWNQRRNDLMEKIDAAILAHFANVGLATSELHSETAGMMIDRLSILALKIRNMDRIAREASAQADGALVGECTSRAGVLRAQRDDLAGCLTRLLEDFAAGRRHFRSYRQLKAYNDERLNPALRAVARK